MENMTLPTKHCECGQCDGHVIIDEEAVKRIMNDMAMCLTDDGDLTRLNKETFRWMEVQGYFIP